MRKRIDGGWYRVDVIGHRYERGELVVSLDEDSIQIMNRLDPRYWFWMARALIRMAFRRG